MYLQYSFPFVSKAEHEPLNGGLQIDVPNKFWGHFQVSEICFQGSDVNVIAAPFCSCHVFIDL